MQILVGQRRTPVSLGQSGTIDAAVLSRTCMRMFHGGCGAFFLEYAPGLTVALRTEHALDLACEMMAMYHNRQYYHNVEDADDVESSEEQLLMQDLLYEAHSSDEDDGHNPASWVPIKPCRATEQRKLCPLWTQRRGGLPWPTPAVTISACRTVVGDAPCAATPTKGPASDRSRARPAARVWAHACPTCPGYVGEGTAGSDPG